MLIQFSLNAADMGRACCRLGATLTDGSRCGNDLIAFNIDARGIEITVDGVSEGLAAKVQRKGKVYIPCAVLHGVIRTLPYFGRRQIEVGFSEGKMRVDSMVFHSRKIVLSDSVRSERPPSFLERGSFSTQVA